MCLYIYRLYFFNNSFNDLDNLCFLPNPVMFGEYGDELGEFWFTLGVGKCAKFEVRFTNFGVVGDKFLGVASAVPAKLEEPTKG